MSRGKDKRAGRTVAVTGATGDLASLLLPLLASDKTIDKVVAIDSAMALGFGGKIEFTRLDLTHPDAFQSLADLLTKHRVDALYHLAFLSGRVHKAAFAHELEVVGSMHVLQAVATAKVRRLIFPSLTALYGARPNRPALLPESSSLLGCPQSRFINDKVDVELKLVEFAKAHPEIELVLLRFAPIIGRSIDNPITRWLKTRMVLTLFGYDPLWQLVHEEDAAQALYLALDNPKWPADGRSGVVQTFNIVGTGVLPLSGVIRQARAIPVPLPLSVAESATRVLEAVGVAAVPVSLLDYFRYSWVADGGRAEAELKFHPRYASKEAAAAI